MSVPSSPYRSNGWKVKELKEELKLRNMKTSGRKEELIHRLEVSDGWTVRDLTPSKNAPGTPTRRSKRVPQTPLKLERTREPPVENLSKFNLILIGKHFFNFCGEQIKAGFHLAVSNWILSLVAVFLLQLYIVLSYTQGPHSLYLDQFQYYAFWYGRWFFLGVLSSIGLGTGAHTFLLFLGPFIARVTTLAYECGNLDFATEGLNSFICNGTASSVSILQIALKVKWEAFLWGAGTAFGELPPYFIARASALAGEKSEELEEIQSLESKKATTLFEKLHLAMFWLVKYLGFIGILACASIPNPLFDLAGITCGYFKVPFLTFWIATFIGKALIKASIQTLFIILLFSKDNISVIVNLIKVHYPDLAASVSNWLALQKTNFESGNQGGSNVVASIWSTFMLGMICYFLFNLVYSLANANYRNSVLLKRLK